MRPFLWSAPLALLCVALGIGAVGCASSSSPTAARVTATATTLASPTATPTARDELILHALGAQAQSVTTTAGTGSGTLVVTITIGGTIPSGDAAIAAAHERVKTLCYLALRAVLTAGIAAGEVTVIVQGPVLDEYANRVIGLYGSAIVEPRTAARLDWAQLTADSAWALYDHVYLVNDFYPVD